MTRRVQVSIYTDHPSAALRVEEVAGTLEAHGLGVELMGDISGFLGDGEALAALTASTLVHDIETPLEVPVHPGAAELGAEVSRVRGEQPFERTLYDGNWLQRVYYAALGRALDGGDLAGKVHIILTGRLFVTYEDTRYHARVVLGGTPSLLSTTGIVEAPARPREYYFLRSRLLRLGDDSSVLDEHFAGKYLKADDPLIARAAGPYAMQAVFFWLTGEDFCDDPGCCRFNSHQQSEVLAAQVDGELCGGCSDRLKRALGA